MQWQKYRFHLTVSAVIVCAVALYYGAAFFSYQPQPVRIINIPPLKGHWLKTSEESWYVPPPVEPKKKTEKKALNTKPEAEHKEVPALNRLADTLNIMYIWTDNGRLKVISITTFNKETKKAAIVIVPLNTVVNDKPGGKPVTIEELYTIKGREGIKTFLKQQMVINISNFVHVNQSALQKLSDIIGVLEVNGKPTTMMEAFEDTAKGVRTDDQDVVKCVAEQILQPKMLLEIPNLIWIFSHEFVTDLTTNDMLSIFHLSRQMDLKNMVKTALTGEESVEGGRKVRRVSEYTWKNIIYETTYLAEEPKKS